jgi:hypothetical protein
MSVMFGVIFAITGIRTAFFTVSVKRSHSANAWPTLWPEPSTVMCGHEKFSSSMSAPLSAAAFARYAHSSFENPMMLAMMGRSGYVFFR